MAGLRPITLRETEVPLRHVVYPAGDGGRDPATFSKPPEIVELSPLAVFSSPPEIVEPAPLAVFSAPPETVDESPAWLPRPPPMLP